MSIYRFHIDLSGFNFPDWESCRSSIFKDDCDFNLVVFEIAKDTKKHHWQGVCTFQIPASTITSRIKRFKNKDAKRGCYSFSKQDPRKLDGYLNYLHKGSVLGTLPVVLFSPETPERQLQRHNDYWKRQRTDTDLMDAVFKAVQDTEHVYDTLELQRQYDKLETLSIALWRRINSLVTHHLLATTDNGFVLSQIQRLSTKCLSLAIKKYPDSVATQIPAEIASRSANGMI